MRQNRVKKALKLFAVTVLWLVVWQLLAVSVGEEILIPSPRAAFIALCTLGKTAGFWQSVALSLFRISAGYIAGIVFGLAGAVLSTRFSVFKAIFAPILHLVRAVPVASFIILAFVWIESPRLPAFISFLMVLPMIWSAVESSLDGIDKKYLEMAQVFRISPFKTLFRIKLPFILPSFAAASINALGFAWKSGIAAEVICRPQLSLGKMLNDSKLYLDTPGVFALTAVVAVLSLLLEVLVRRIATKFKAEN